MKIHLYFVLVLSLLISCNSRRETVSDIGGIVITCRFSDMEANGETPESIKAILLERLSYLAGKPAHPFFRDNDSLFVLELPGVTEINTELLFSHGRMGIWEVYKRNEIQAYGKNHELDSLFVSYYSPKDNYIGSSSDAILLFQVAPDQSPTIDSLLNRRNIRSQFPNDIKFAWTLSGLEYDVLDLYLLKKSNDNIDLNATFKWGQVNKVRDNFELHIKLNTDGAAQFAALTYRNIGRQLAVVMDDKVLYAPRVNNKIVGGSMVISGIYSHAELAIFNAVLKSPIIRSKVEILSKTIVEKPSVVK